MAKLCIFLVIAVYAIVVVNGNVTPSVTPPSTPLPRGDDHPTSPPKGKCTDAEKKNIKEKQSNMTQCYSEIIKTYLGEKNTSFTCLKADDLKTKWHQPFLDVASCYKEKRFNESLNFFYDLLTFTTSNNEFKDFIHHNGSACVSDIRINTNQCIMNATGRQNVTQPNLLLLTVENPEACHEMVKLKDCVIDLMKTKNCDVTGSKFINSLTNFVTKRFCNNLHPPKNTKNSADFTAANVILTTLAALAFI